MIKWKPIPSLEHFEASTNGMVRTKLNKNGTGFSKDYRYIKISTIKNGYNVFGTFRNKIHKTYFVHHLIAETFLGPRPDELYVCHKDGNKNNNGVNNLYYGSNSDNQKDRVLHGTSNRGERCGSAKITNKQALMIIGALNSGKRIIDVSKELDMPYRIVMSIKHGRSWRHLSGY